jgi:hypothetical protein
MKMRIIKVLTLVLLVTSFFGLNAQDKPTLEELKKMKSEKAAQMAAIQGEVGALQKQIDTYPGWKIGGVGLVGFDLNSNNNWYALDFPDSRSSGYGIGLTGFANLDSDKSFWRNLIGVNYRTVTSKRDADDDGIKAVTDALDIASLYGYKLSPKWAASAEGKYSSSLLNLNNPGKLTASLGVTWTPINNLVVLIHPLGYEFNFPSGDYVSSAGAKIGATYAAKIIKGVSWTSNLSAFVPYGNGTGTLKQFPVDNDGDILKDKDPLASLDVDYSTGDLVNWTWINSFSTNIWKGIGVGLNIGLRGDRQLANQGFFQQEGNKTDDNPVQMYYTLGLSYTF